jgi:hypothetical protein
MTPEQFAAIVERDATCKDCGATWDAREDDGDDR